ncbi:MAG: hypothetical protein HFJ02_00875 [Bacilli bacterium]|nr:hypothetical protein [Bacilli bacterium]
MFLPKLLSTLHLASYYLDQKDKEREKKLYKLSKKMLVIVNNYINAERIASLDEINRIELFYKVYSQIENLKPRELKILRDFCYALYNPYDLTIVREHDSEREEEIYYKYKDELNNVIEKKIKRIAISKM